ncbi:thermonuclease family protein [Geodermatophilus sp. SYSU D01180]
MTQPKGTTVDTRITRVVDGDTLVVPVGDRDERLRLLCLDTEESNAGSDKPITPWGREAKKEAERFFPVGEPVVLEFPGTEELDVCLRRYRDNFGRLLVFAHRDGADFQEHMIRRGYSPYFAKYGHAEFDDHRDRYVAAERAAQAAHVGVWDQATVNGSEMRNYALLGTWWALRAALIDDYRQRRAVDPTLLNSRLDYEQLRQLAAERAQVTVFTELAGYTRVGRHRAVVDIGSRAQPFKLFIPDIEADGGQAVLALLDNRYLTKGDDRPRRNYAYVGGRLHEFADAPELTVDTVAQIRDVP